MLAHRSWTGRRLHGDNTIVTNGSVRGMGGDAVVVLGGGRVEYLDATNNGANAVRCSECRVASSIARQNGGTGINCAFGCVVRDNILLGNAGSGVDSVESLVTGNVMERNHLEGLVAASGIFATAFGNNLIQNNAAAETNGAGIQIAPNVCGGVLCP